MEAVIFIGIQAAGRSSFYKECFFTTHLRINLDMLRTRHRERLLVCACLEMKQPFVVDNTNPTIEERQRYIEPAMAAGFQLHGYYVQTALQACLRRNEEREEGARIPVKGIIGTHKRLQPPRWEEGYHRLFTVSLNESGHFGVEEWPNDNG